MRKLYAAAAAFSIFAAPGLFAGPKLLLPNITVGQNLEVFVRAEVDGAPPTKEWSVRIESGDPRKLLLSHTAEAKGEASIVLNMKPGLTVSPEFYVQAHAGSDTVSYTASAPDFESGEGKVTLTPSGIVFVRAAAGILGLRTTSGADRTPLKLVAARLDSELNYVAPQPVAGGAPVMVAVTSSNSRVGTIEHATVTIAPGDAYGEAEFQPLSVGETTVKVSIPAGFKTPSQLGTLPTTVITPGLAVTTEQTLGKNLQIGGWLSLGERAPAEGVTVTLTSEDPKRLLLSLTRTEVGSECIKIAIPSRGYSSPYFLQALDESGTVTYVASAPGYVSRTGVITLAPSGMVLGGPPGPPDEAELFRKEEADNLHGFVTSLSREHATQVTVFAAQLDPKTGRAADLTVQSMRPGVSAAVVVKSSNSAVGKMEPEELVIQPGSDRAVTRFVPLGVGSTDISVSVLGFTKAQNATSLRVIVKE